MAYSSPPEQDNTPLEEFEESPGSRPQASRATPNRPFIISIGVIALIFVIGLIILLYVLFSRGPQQASQARDQAATIVAQNTQMAAAATVDQKRAVELQLTQQAAAKLTAAVTPISAATLTPVTAAGGGNTPTSVVALPSATSLPSATVSAALASQTAAAATATKVAGTGGNKYPPPGPGTPIAGTLGAGTPQAGTPLAPGTPGAGTPQTTPTGLPKTGFADEMGLPGLFGLAALLVVVIFVARRARQTH